MPTSKPNVITGMLSGITGAFKLQRARAENFTASTLASTNRNPAWACRYPIADFTYPEVLHFKHAVEGTTSAASAGTAHTHTTNGTVFTNAFGVLMPNANSFGGYITISNTTVMDTVAVMISKQAGTLNNVYLEVFRENSDGSLTRITSTDISASITTTHAYLEIPLGSQAMQAGERYVVRVRHASTVNTLVRVSALAQDTPNPNAPDISFLTAGSSLSAQTSYTATEAATARAAWNYLSWAMLAAKNIDEPEVSYSDDFNRNLVGPNWLTDLTVSGGRAAHDGTTDGDQVGFYARRTTQDASMVSANLYIDEDATTQRFGIRMHCNREETQSVELSVTGTDAKIYSYASGTPTQRATVDVGGTDLYSLYYDEPNDKYVALKGGVEFGLEWDSVGSAVEHGSDYRFGGIRITRASGVNAGDVDNWVLNDFSA